MLILLIEFKAIKMEDFDKLSVEAFKISLKKMFKELNFDIKGAKILDVGCSKGYHAKAMEEMGADVYVNDVHIDKLAIEFSEEKKIGGFIQDIPKQHQGQFDVVTAFRIFDEHEGNPSDFYQGMAKAIKPDGKVVIGMAEAIYIEGEVGAAKFIFKNVELAINNEEKSSMEKNAIESGNNLIYVASEPKHISMGFDLEKGG